MQTQLVLDLCSGIGGFTLGGMISGGFQTIAFCEVNEYCQQVLSLRFPNIPIFPDLKALGNAIVPSCAAIAFDKLKSILD